MCGIVGVFNIERYALSMPDHKFFRDALVMDTMRGWDSTGMYCIRARKAGKDTAPVAYLKATDNGAEFVRSKQFNAAVSLRAYNAEWSGLIGHNRAATKGSVSVPNAHPFMEGPITLVHNGTVHNVSDLPHDLERPVDSWLIAANLAAAGVDAAAVEILPHIRGSYALVWHDARDDSLNFVRNDSRPLHFAKAQYSNKLYFMSEGEMLNACLKRNTIQFENIYSLGAHTLLKFLPNAVKPKATKFTDAPRPFVQSPLYRPPAVQSSLPTRVGTTEVDEDPPTPYIRVSGKTIESPQVMQEMLQWMGAKPGQIVTFSPEYYRPLLGTSFVAVQGTADVSTSGASCEEKAEIIAPLAYVQDSFHKTWDIRLLAVRWQSCGTKSVRGKDVEVEDPVYMGLLKNKESATSRTEFVPRAWTEQWLLEGCQPVIRTSTKKQETTTTGDTEDLDHEYDGTGPGTTRLLNGPDNKMVTLGKFQELVEDGCCMCQSPIYEFDHEHLAWVGEFKTQPLCRNCQWMDRDEQAASVH